MNDERSHTFEFFQCFIGLCYGMILQLECETPLNVVLGTVESQSAAIPCPHRSLYLGLLLAPPFFLPLREIESWNEKRENELPTFLPQLKRRLVPKGKHTCALEIFLELQKRGSNIESTNRKEPGYVNSGTVFCMWKNRWFFTNYRYEALFIYRECTHISSFLNILCLL